MGAPPDVGTIAWSKKSAGLGPGAIEQLSVRYRKTSRSDPPLCFPFFVLGCNWSFFFFIMKKTM